MFSTIEKLITVRNLRPKKKEGFLKVISIFSFLGIMLGVAILIIVMSVMNGFREELTQKILGFNSHISIKPYDVKINNDFHQNLKNKYKDADILRTFNGEAVIITNDLAKGILIRGIDKNEVQNIGFFKKNIIDGNLENFGNEKIIIGKQLAIELDVVVGDKINIMSSSLLATPLGVIPKQSVYTVAAVFSSGLFEFDKSVTFFNLTDSLSFFEKNEDDINLEFFLKNPLKADIYKEEIQKTEPNLYVYSWSDINKTFFSALKVERNVMFLILTLIIIVAAFNIISGLTILIKNKTKEIAILKSLGLSRKSIIKSFFFTGFLIGFFATIVGIAFGVVFSIYIEEVRQFISALTNFEIFPKDIYFLDEMPSKLSIRSIITISVFSIFVTILTSLLPSLSVSKIETIKALKYE
ncbi:MAG: lipoprotein-releasing system transmembrane subunit LolC [Candidatus Marinimicrobia bacterium]|nr:lipoprotein-releasing system transmembrane subunit LolC [Candidatus Neomarinimicrobiota bacterium]RPG05916.1 MAG: lipoprotein-releasing ABC transporter permease subunit [Pelagibacteraceae bacterium TMED247]